MKNSSKSICLVAPFAGSILSGGKTAGGGGAERQLLLLGGALLDLGWEVGFVTSPEGESDKLVDHRFKVNRVPFHFLKGTWLRLLQDFRLLWHALDEQGANIVGIRAGGPMLLGLLKLWSLINGAKLIVWVQSDGDFAPDAGKARSESIFRRLARYIYHRQIFSANLLIAQTNYQYVAITKLTRRPCALIPSFVTSQTLKTGEAAGLGAPIILWAGNPTHNKRIHIVLELAKRLPAYTFVVAMNPGDKLIIEYARTQAALFKNIQFLGPVPSHQMEEWFDRASVVLNTSILEGFPNTFLQAWARSIPVVTAGVDPDGVINKYGMGVVVPVMDDDTNAIEQLASAIQQIIESSELRANMGQAGHDYILARHSTIRVGRQMDKAFTHLLNAHEG